MSVTDQTGVRVFISNRREDTPHLVGRLYDRLIAELGEPNVFLDVQSTPLGSDFRRVIEQQIDGADVVLVVIGARWPLERLRLPNDFVFAEIESALRLDKLVIPVLDGTTTMPTETDLPSEIAQLSFRQLARLRPGADFRHDLDRLMSDLVQRTADRRRNRPEDEEQLLDQLERLSGERSDPTATAVTLAERISSRLRESPVKNATHWYRLGAGLYTLGQISLAVEPLRLATTGHNARNAPIGALELRALCEIRYALALADQRGVVDQDVDELVHSAHTLVEFLVTIDGSPERHGIQGNVRLRSACIERLPDLQRAWLRAPRRMDQTFGVVASV